MEFILNRTQRQATEAQRGDFASILAGLGNGGSDEQGPSQGSLKSKFAAKTTLRLKQMASVSVDRNRRRGSIVQATRLARKSPVTPRSLAARRMHLEALFNLVDVDGGGRLSFDGMVHVIQTNPLVAQVLSLNFPENTSLTPEIHRMFEVMDENRDGIIDCEEFIQYFVRAGGAYSEHSPSPRMTPSASGENLNVLGLNDDIPYTRDADSNPRRPDEFIAEDCDVEHWQNGHAASNVVALPVKMGTTWALAPADAVGLSRPKAFDTGLESSTWEWDGWL